MKSETPTVSLEAGTYIRHQPLAVCLLHFLIHQYIYLCVHVGRNQIRYQSTLTAGRKMKTLQILLFIATVGLLLLVGKHVAMWTGL